MAKELVSMKRTAEDKRKDMGSPCPVDCIAPDYPWGLTFNLGTDEIEKLGMSRLPEVGTEFTMTAKVKVTRVEQSSSSDSRDKTSESRNIALQLTDMALEGGRKP